MNLSASPSGHKDGVERAQLLHVEGVRGSMSVPAARATPTAGQVGFDGAEQAVAGRRLSSHIVQQLVSLGYMALQVRKST